MNFGYEQVEIRSVQDNFRTIQVEYGTVQDNDSTKSGEIFGQYMMLFKQIKLKCGYVQVETRTVRDEN